MENFEVKYEVKGTFIITVEADSIEEAIAFADKTKGWTGTDRELDIETKKFLEVTESF